MSFLGKIEGLLNPLKKIHEISLNGNSKEITSFLTSNKEKIDKLEKLELFSLNSSDFEVLNIFHGSKIKDISIMFNNFENSIINYISLLVSLKHLETLKLSINFPMDLNIVLAVNKCLTDMQNLKSLSFELKLGSLTPFIKIFVETFAKMKNLSHLNLDYCNAYLYDSDVKFLLNTLGNVENLKFLEICPKQNFFDLLEKDKHFENLTSLIFKSHYDFEEKFLQKEFLRNLRELVVPNFIEGSNINLQLEKFAYLEKLILKTKINENGSFFRILKEIKTLNCLKHLELFLELGSNFNCDNNTLCQTLNNSLLKINSLTTLVLAINSFLKIEIDLIEFEELKKLEKISLSFSNVHLQKISLVGELPLRDFDLNFEHCNDEIDEKYLKTLCKSLLDCKMLRNLNLISVKYLDLEEINDLEKSGSLESMKLSVFLKENQISKFKELKLPKNIKNLDLNMESLEKGTKNNHNFFKDFMISLTNAKKNRRLKVNFREIRVSFDFFSETIESIFQKKSGKKLEIFEIEVTLEEIPTNKNIFMEKIQKIVGFLSYFVKFDLTIHFVANQQVLNLLLDKASIGEFFNMKNMIYEVDTLPIGKRFRIRKN